MSSLENGLTILGLLDRDRPVLRVGEVCRQLGLPKSSVSRLLQAMGKSGLLERESGNIGYVAGPRALLLGNLYVARHSLTELVNAAVDALVEEFSFTGYASALSGGDIVLLRVRQGAYPLRYVRAVGDRLPAWKTAMGHALLSRLAAKEARARLDASVAAGAAAKGLDPAALVAKLGRDRQTRYVRERSVLTPGISTIATALVDASTGDLMSVCLAFPESAADPALQRRMIATMLAKSQEIGTAVGDPHWSCC